MNSVPEHFVPRILKAFWSQVTITDNCWLWNGNLDKGYGKIAFGYKPIKAHRMSYMLFNGDIPLDKNVIRHTCDNSICVNPLHLLCGTVLDNVQDMFDRGYSPKGEGNHNSKLTLQQIELIKHLYSTRQYTQKALGKQFDVCQTQISKIIRGAQWK